MLLSPDDRRSMQRGELSLERTRVVAGNPITYKVERITDGDSP
jgi:hypothetical protein